jgi:hypothetical protein
MPPAEAYGAFCSISTLPPVSPVAKFAALSLAFASDSRPTGSYNSRT